MLGRDCKIKIDGGKDQVFFPGAPIHGTVVYKASANDRLGSVNLDLHAVIKISPTKLGSSAAGNESKPQTEHIEIFHISEKILTEPVWTERKTLSWDFTMVLPEFTGPDHSHGRYVDAGNPLFEEAPHHLPPSLGPDQSGEVEIAYNMYAVAKRSFRGYGATEQLQEAPVVDNIRSLIFRPNPPIASSESVSVVEKEWPLTSFNKQRKFSLKPSSTSSSLDQVHAGGPPTVIAARLPTRIDLGENVNIKIYLLEQPDHEETSGDQIALKSISSSIRALTHRRTAKMAHNPALTETRTKKLGSDSPKGLITVGSSGVSQGFSTESIKAWPPTFKSYSVSRMYELVVEAVVLKGKEEFKNVFVEEVEVMNKLSAEDAMRRSSVAPPALPALGPREDDVLPGYSRHDPRA